MVRIEQLASPRILAGQPGDIYVYPYAAGALLTGAPTSPTVTVVDAAGATVVATTAATWDGSAKRLTYSLSAAQNPRPRVLTATWAFTAAAGDGGAAYSLTVTHETTGDVLYTETEARVYDNSALANTTTFPTDTLLRTRDQVQDTFEAIIGVALGGRGAREIYDGNGTQMLELRRSRISTLRTVSERAAGTQTWTAYTAPQLADILIYPGGMLRRETLGGFTFGYRNVAIEYDYGLQPVPLDLRQAGLRITRNLLVKSNLDDRMMSQTTQLGVSRLAVAGFRDGSWFGIPPVDSLLAYYRTRYYLPSIR